jgi:hypothetical protein
MCVVYAVPLILAISEREDGRTFLSNFAQFLKENRIDPFALAKVANLRYPTIWNAIHDKPITEEHAIRLCIALTCITKAVYSGTFLTYRTQGEENHG